MFRNIQIPSSYTFIKKGKVYLLIKDEYKDLLLEQGIEDLKTFLKKHLQNTRYLDGRTPHPSVPIKDQKRMVIRHYIHGGLFRALTRHLYIFNSRSFRELALTEEIRSCGIPTIEPIGAIHQTIFPSFYKAYLLTLEAPQFINLIQYFQNIGPSPSHEELTLKRRIIRSAGNMIRQLHQAGFFHSDLQLKNILVKGNQLLIIDFDRSYRKQSLSIRERMKNLLRLNRSAEKWRHLGLPITQADQWRFFLAYAGDDRTIRKAMKRALRTYSIRSFLYRLGWVLKKILGSY